MDPFSVDDLIAMQVVGEEVADPRVNPRFDTEKQLVLSTAEEVVWTGRALSTRASRAIDFTQLENAAALFSYREPLEVTLTNQRTVFRLTTIPQGASKAWVVAGAAGLLAGKMVTGMQMRDKVVAGQIRHVNVAGVQTEVRRALIGVKDRYVVLHAMLPRAAILTLRLLVKEDVHELASMMASVVAANRVECQAEWLDTYEKKASKLRRMHVAPTQHETPWGAMYGFPLVAARSDTDTPFEVFQERRGTA